MITSKRSLSFFYFAFCLSCTEILLSFAAGADKKSEVGPGSQDIDFVSTVSQILPVFFFF